MTVRWTVEAGRQVYFDGRPFLSINKAGDAQPVEADAAVHFVVECLNEAGVTPDALYDRQMSHPRRSRVARASESVEFEVVSRDRAIAHILAPDAKSAYTDMIRGQRSGWYPSDATIRDPRSGETYRPMAAAREPRRSYSMTYGTLPPYEQFLTDIRRIDPDYDDDRAYWPEGTLYPMELVSDAEVTLAEGYGGLEPFEPFRYKDKSGFRGDERAIYGFLEYLIEAFNDGDEEAGDLASSIMTTLGYEWI